MPPPSASQPESTGPQAVAHDWPDWMNPILVKELRQSLRSRWFEIIFLGLCGSLTLVTVLGAVLDAPRGSKFFFWAAVILTLHLLLPLRTALSAKDDRQRGNLELIRVTGLSAEKLANQRITALFFHTLVITSVILPFVMLRYFLGGVDLVDELQYLVMLVLSAPVLGVAILWMVVVSSNFGRVFIGGMLFFLVPVYEMLAFGAAFGSGESAFVALVFWLLGTLIGGVFFLAFTVEAFLLHGNNP